MYSKVTFSYRISGLELRSELPLAEMIAADTSVASDIEFRRSAVAASLESPLRKGPDWELTESQFLFWVEDLGRFLVSNGHTIDVELRDGADPLEASPFLTGLGLSALLLQRGGLSLHASAVSRDGGAIALCGESGAGKSTLAAALCQAGWDFVSDDVCHIERLADGRPVVWPDGRRFKLFEQSIETLALEHRRGREVRAGLGKHYVTPSSQPTTAITLDAIYALRYHDEPDTSCVRLSPLNASQLLLTESHCRFVARAIARSRNHLEVSAAIASRVPVFLLKRPRGLSGIEHTVRALNSNNVLIGAV